MTPRDLSEAASAVLEVLTATAELTENGSLISSETLYSFLMDRFGLSDPEARRERTRAMGELTERGLVRRINTRSRSVELLADAVVPTTTDFAAIRPSYDEYVAAWEELDVPVSSTRRREQDFLRNVLLAGRVSATCDLCGTELPAALLVAAHIQRRSELDNTARARFREIAMLACSLGCDTLYECGYLAVSSTGLLLVASEQPGQLGQHLARLRGRPCAAFTPASASHFQQHRGQRFLG
jgi:hypothetical protein